MGILYRYVFREILSSAVLGTLLATAVIFLQRLGNLFALLVRSSAKPDTVAYLFALALPPVLPFTLPFGVLVGILIGLGRMSTDGEIIAMRAAGVPSRKVIPPVVAFALIATAITALASVYLMPLSIRETYRIVNRLAAAQVSAEIQPRVFEEQFTNKVLYVGEVKPGPVVVWQKVFLADLTPPEQRAASSKEPPEGPVITVAREAIAVADPDHNRIELSLRDASTHEIAKDLTGTHTSFPHGQQVLETPPPEEKHAREFYEMDTRELPYHATHAPNWVDARIELHRRLALPIACLTLALVGIPLGVSSRKGGKSGGYVTAVFLAFFCYYLAFITLIGLARQRTLPVEIALWLPNAVFGAIGLVFLLRLERPGDRDLMGTVREGLQSIWAGVKARLTPTGWPAAQKHSRERRMRVLVVPQLLDTYVLQNFLFYFGLLLASFVLMTQIYNFFELLSDIIKNKIPMSHVLTYHIFLTPKLVYDTLPISVLVAALVTFGLMTKHNETTAFKACGVSLYRLAAPVLLASAVLSVGLFAFDYSYVPEANLKQDAIRNEIKNRPVQTYLFPNRKWIFGSGDRIYYYKYYDTIDDVLVGVNVYELDHNTYQLRRHISAERAQWQPSLKAWVFQNGWTRDIEGTRENNFRTYQATVFPELTERPNYFLKEVKQEKQMNFRELDRYIRDLKQSGFDTVRLQVQFYKKFAVPLFALIMAMISAPFGFLVGSRGAMTSVAVSIGIAIGYWSVGLLFEQIGNISHLPPALAAWSPDAVFSLAGGYLMLRMRS